MMDAVMIEQIEAYGKAIVADYEAYLDRYFPDADRKVFTIEVSYEEGPKYVRMATTKGGQKSVHAFIVKEDDGKFRKGDILKAAGWKAPAKNAARGSIYELTPRVVKWTGAT